MSEEKIPKEVAAFIADHVDSVLQLEVLLLLRNYPQRHWTAAEIDEELRSNREWLAAQLADFCRRGMLHCVHGKVPTYQYAPADEQLGAAISALAAAYSTHRVTIISMIYSKPTDRLRIFADAFRLRKDKPNG